MALESVNSRPQGRFDLPRNTPVSPPIPQTQAGLAEPSERMSFTAATVDDQGQQTFTRPWISPGEPVMMGLTPDRLYTEEFQGALADLQEQRVPHGVHFMSREGISAPGGDPMVPECINANVPGVQTSATPEELRSVGFQAVLGSLAKNHVPHTILLEPLHGT